MTNHESAATEPSSSRMPVVFVGHGSPMNLIEDNRWSRGFTALGSQVPRPRAVLAVSAHWYVGGTYLTGNARPRTIHDFGGFPSELYEIEYPAPGSEEVARRARDLIARAEESDASPDLATDWGLDHGTWSVLRWTYPEADIPVVQLSIDRRLDPRAHYAIGRSLAALREEGVLILGSGNITHNLGDAFARMRSGATETPAWAARFDADVTRVLQERDTETLLSLSPGTEDGRMAHPTPDHWLPLIYAYAATDESDAASFPVEGFDLGSLSMRNVIFGGAS